MKALLCRWTPEGRPVFPILQPDGSISWWAKPPPRSGLDGYEVSADDLPAIRGKVVAGGLFVRAVWVNDDGSCPDPGNRDRIGGVRVCTRATTIRLFTPPTGDIPGRRKTPAEVARDIDHWLGAETELARRDFRIAALNQSPEELLATECACSIEALDMVADNHDVGDDCTAANNWGVDR